MDNTELVLIYQILGLQHFFSLKIPTNFVTLLTSQSFSAWKLSGAAL